MVGDIWGMDGSNPVAARVARAASIGTGTAASDSTTNNRGSARDGSGANDSGGNREAQRRNRQTHSYRR